MKDSSPIRRRDFLKYTGALSLAAYLPFNKVLGETDDSPTKKDPNSPSFRILSCNIRHTGFNEQDSKTNDHWDARKEICAEIILKQNADIICCQEVYDAQFNYLLDKLPGYQWSGMRGKKALKRDPFHVIFFRKDRFEKITSGGYWLSEKPHVPGSRSWNSVGVRMAEWLRLVEKASNKEFRIINTHLDHISQLARVEQAKMILEDAEAYPKTFPQIVTGDFNADMNNPCVKLFLDAGWIDSYAAVHGNEDPGFTFHGFRGPDYEKVASRVNPETFQTVKLSKESESFPKLGKIDWILLHGNIRSTAAEIIRDQRNGHFPSDHYFVSATVELT